MISATRPSLGRMAAGNKQPPVTCCLRPDILSMCRQRRLPLVSDITSDKSNERPCSGHASTLLLAFSSLSGSLSVCLSVSLRGCERLIQAYPLWFYYSAATVVWGNIGCV